MANLPDIRKEILGDNYSKRIVIKVNTKLLDPQDYRASANSVASEIFPEWESDSRIIFLAIDVWSERTFLVIDVNRHDYDFHTAHRSKIILPVYVLRQRGKNRGWALVRWPQEDEPLAAKLADLHNVNGFDVPTPFLENHNSRIVHANPREFPV
ncbi:uncharacterized protein N7515_002103 [Penicillium bovifimosum]|uniref:Uncharacterized protein n=1 Tax=Penicillium bovifimosum TaxID=126998 RepID=A0A9W9HCT9_9EURO|nr:uncharacterized protein N7515_002103 [Penicillium bovifimosum]KAJ5143316.1 hypothetical protein N7515_002103 [Penicillium bovifimosum]